MMCKSQLNYLPTVGNVLEPVDSEYWKYMQQKTYFKVIGTVARQSVDFATNWLKKWAWLMVDNMPITGCETV